eukprot:12596_1
MRDKEDCAKKMNQMMMKEVRHAQQLECAKKKELSDATQQMTQQQITAQNEVRHAQQLECKKKNYRVQYEEKMTVKRKLTQTKQELGDALHDAEAKRDTDKQHAQMKQQMQQLLAKYSLQHEELAELRTAQDKLR